MTPKSAPRLSHTIMLKYFRIDHAHDLESI
jgi:hypothetical protein